MAVHFSRVKGDSAGGVIAGPSVPAVQKYPVGKLQIIGRPPRGDMVHTSIRHHALPRPPRLPPLTHTPCPDVVRRFILRVICSALLHEGGWRKTRFFFLHGRHTSDRIPFEYFLFPIYSREKRNDGENYLTPLYYTLLPR